MSIKIDLKSPEVAELAVMMCEASYGINRPEGMTAQQAFEAMEPECREGWRRAVFVALGYFTTKYQTRH